MLLDTAEGSANLKDKAPYERFVTQYANFFNNNIRLQLSRSRGLGSGSAKSRREANAKHACNMKFLKMKNLIGSLAEDFHCFETWALSNQQKNPLMSGQPRNRLVGILM